MTVDQLIERLLQLDAGDVQVVLIDPSGYSADDVLVTDVEYDRRRGVVLS